MSSLPRLLQWCLASVLAAVSHAYVSKNQTNALYSLYNATNGDWWVWDRTFQHDYIGDIFHFPNFSGIPWNFSVADPDPCLSPPNNWEGVNCSCSASSECNIVELFLPAHNLTGTLPFELTELTYLQGLDLSINNITGTIPDFLQNITTLTILAFAWNNLMGPIPTWFNQLPLLEVLVISRNNLAGTIPSSIYSMSSLTAFQASDNYLTGTLSAEWAQLPNLQMLGIAGNNISGTLPEELCSLSKLMVIDMGFNNLTSTIPACVGELANLTALLLGRNFLTGTIPTELSSCHNMETLSFIHNNFTGTLPNFLPSFPNLSVVFFDHNSFTGTIPENIGNCTELTSFHMAGNHIHGSVPQSFRNLKKIAFVSISFNLLSGNLAGIFDEASEMRYFTVGHNTFTGPVPTFAGDSLFYLFAWNNLLEGSIPAALFAYSNISTIGLTQNQLTGSIPVPSGPLPSSMPTLPYQYITVSTNFLSGSVPINDNPMDYLEQFIASHNYLTGTIPSTIGNLSQLNELNLMNNLLSGTLPKSMLRLTELEELYLSHNLFVGSLENLAMYADPSANYRLSALDISHNTFSGELPSFVTALPHLAIIVASTNCFTGSISSGFCDSAYLSSLVLDGLSTAHPCRVYNFPGTGLTGFRLKERLQGTLPTCLFNMSSLKTLHLGGNGLKGTLPDFDELPRNLYEVYLAHNRLTGTIPFAFQQKRMHSLDLSYNGFRGVINDNFTAVNASGSLELEVNFLSGDLPSGLSDVGTIDVLNGNLFWCSYSRGNLPKNDPASSTYACDSQVIDSSIILWVSTIGMIVLLGLFWAYRESHSLRLALPLYLVVLWERYKRNNKLLRSDFTAPYQSSSLYTANARSSQAREERISRFNNSMGQRAESEATFENDDEDEGQEDFTRASRMNEHSTHRYTFEMEDPQTSLHVSRDTQFSGSFKISLAKSFASVVVAPHTKQASIALVMEFYEDIRSLFVMVALFCLFILLPVNVWLSSLYGTHAHSYTWKVSATLLHGDKPAWVLAVLFAVMYAASISFIRYCLRKYPYQKRELTSWLRSVRNVRASIRLVAIVLLDLSLMFTIDYTYYHSVSAYGVEALLSIQILTSSLKLIWNEYILWALVPIAKGTIGETLPFNRPTSVQHGMEMQSIRRPMSKSISARLQSTASSMIQLVNNYSYDYSDVRALTIMVLLNTIVVPAVVLAFITPSCFLHAFVAPKRMSTEYRVVNCVLYADVRNQHQCIATAPYVGISEYDPPFFYDYQCSSVIYNTYCPVFVIMFLTAGIVIPTFNVICHILYYQLPEESRLRRTFLDWWLSLRMKPPVLATQSSPASTNAPMDFKPPSSPRSTPSVSTDVLNPLSSATPDSSNSNADDKIADVNDKCKDPQEESKASVDQVSGKQKSPTPHQETSRVLERERFVVQVVCLFGIVITYGAVFPPLAVIGTISIYCLTHVEQYFLGRLLEAADRLQMLWYRDEIKSECYRIFDIFHVAITLVYYIMPFAIGVLLFDTTAFDESKAYGAAVALSFIALTLLFAVAYEVLVVRYGGRVHQEVQQMIMIPASILPTISNNSSPSVDDSIPRTSVRPSAASLTSPLSFQENRSPPSIPSKPATSDDIHPHSSRPLPVPPSPRNTDTVEARPAQACTSENGLEAKHNE